MTGITRQQAAEAVAALFGTSARRTRESRTYDPWEAPDQEGKKWRFVYDASIVPTRPGGLNRANSSTRHLYHVEMNSPVLEYGEMGKLQAVVRALRRAGAVVNSSCGMHVHVDAVNHTPQSLKNALTIMYAKEDILFKALKVNENRVQRWCQKVREPMLEKIRKMPTHLTMEQLKQQWYEGTDESRMHYSWTRYYALNLHSVFYRGTLEWRWKRREAFENPYQGTNPVAGKSVPCEQPCRAGSHGRPPCPSTWHQRHRALCGRNGADRGGVGHRLQLVPHPRKGPFPQGSSYKEA